MLHEDDIARPVGLTLERYIQQKQNEFPSATGEFSQLLRDLALAAKIVNREVNQGSLLSLRGPLMSNQSSPNAQSLRLDDTAHELFVRALQRGGEVCGILTPNGQLIDTGNRLGIYVVTLNPLDGFSDPAVSLNIGTLFSIYRRVSGLGTPATPADFAQGGRKLVAAGYVLYGASTMLVYTTGQGVSGFTFQPLLGEFYLSHPVVTVPDEGRGFGCDESHWFDYPEPVRAFLTACKQRTYRSRFVGSLVADFHQCLFAGGIFLSPATAQQPEGELSLISQCLPLAFLMEQAGGLATDGNGPVLDLEPADVAQRSPLFVGSPDVVEELMSASEAVG